MAKKEEHHLHLALLLLIRSANDVGGLDIHSVNAASAASYAQTACKEASSAAHSGKSIGKRKERRSVACPVSIGNDPAERPSLLALSPLTTSKNPDRQFL